MAQIAPEKVGSPKASQPTVDFYTREMDSKDIMLPSFQPGETVKLKGSLSLNSDGLVSVDPVYDGALRPTVRPQFLLGKLQEHPELKQLIGKPAELTVTINRHSGVAQFHNYESTLVGAPVPIVPADFSERTLKSYALRYVAVEGTIRKIENQNENKPGILTLSLKNGGEVSISHNSSELTYASGVHENTAGQELQVGDDVQLTAFVRPEGTLQLNADPYMSRANSSREQEYQAHRSEMNERIASLGEALSSKNLVSLREQVGQFAMREPTVSERNRVYKLLEQLPVEQRPVYNEQMLEYSYAHSLTKAYGENVYAKTRNELIDYTLRIDQLQGKPEFPVDRSYAYRLLEPAGIPLKVQELVFCEAIDAIKPQVIGVDSSKVNSRTKHLLENAISHLASLRTQSGTDRLVALLDEQLKGKHYRPLGWQPGDPSPDNVIAKVSQSLSRLSGDPRGLLLLDRHFLKINAAGAMLQNFSAEDIAAERLGQVIGNILLKRAAPKLQASHQLQLPDLPTS